MIKKITNITCKAGVMTLALLMTFTAVEPAVSFGASAQSQFTISQTTTTEISFSTFASNVTLSPSLGGITGGTANGQTQVVVTTNDIIGYNMTIQASTSLGMQGTASSTNYIPAYSTTTPDYNFVLPANTARFGYTVNASTTGDVVQFFRNNGTICNQSGGTSNGSNCWIGATTTAVTIVNRNLPTQAPGATTTLYFRVGIAANPIPAIPNDTYVATSTLTATAN